MTESSPSPIATRATPGARTWLEVSGMNCANCAGAVARALESVEGVALARVSLERQEADVTWRQGLFAQPNALVRAVEAAGYRARPRLEPADPDQAAAAAAAVWRFQVVFAFLLTVPLMIGEWFLHWSEIEHFRWVEFAFAAPVLAVCGSKFFRGAWQQLRRGSANMDTLVALGSSTAFGYSVWGLLSGWGGHLYFMEASAIIAFISLGHWLEAVATSHAAGTLKALFQLAPDTASRVQPDGSEQVVPAETLSPGDRIVLRPGDRLPADGRVIEGSCALDESMLTGEAMPIEKAAGSTVFAGTLNRDGRLLVEVSETGRGTALARIIEHLERAQASRARIQRLGDRVSAVFVPIVVLAALGSAAWWGLAYGHAVSVHRWFEPWLWQAALPDSPAAAAAIHAAAVLIVACPCAMGLATPVAILVGTQVAARRGILIRDGQALEKSGLINSVAFDKTGTLTRGEPVVAGFFEFPDGGGARPLAAALARISNHPLSRALAGLANEKIELDHGREIRGCGIEARARGPRHAGAVVRLGSLDWLRSTGVAMEPARDVIERESGAAAIWIGVAAAQQLLGIMSLRDELKPGVAAMLRELRQRGCRVRLVTGDRSAAAAEVARAAGFAPDEVMAEATPEKKLEWIRAWQARGEKIAFVGDGINDAPALQQADLGIAVSRASDVARSAADLILLQSDIHTVPEALALARATLRTIRQNLFWAFFYNAAAVPLAMLGYLDPIICALAMGLSDLLVIGNSLRLGRFTSAAATNSTHAPYRA